MIWVALLVLIAAFVGLVMGTTGLKSMRSHTNPQAEINWTQPPLSPWRYETLTMVAISLHSLGLVCLAALVLASVSSSTLFLQPIELNQSLLLFVFALFAVSFSTYASGVMVAYHIAQPWIRPVSYGISSEGMYYGGSLIGWKSYSHYELGPEKGLISLYSSYSPPLRTWVIQPPAESFSSVLRLIQQNLPSAPPSDFDSWQRSPFGLILSMSVLDLAVLLPVLWGWTQNRSWTWSYALIAFFFLQYLGIKLITLFDGRGQSSGTETQNEEHSHPGSN